MRAFTGSGLLLLTAAVLCACGGGTGISPEGSTTPTPASSLVASPASISVNLLSGSPTPAQIAISGANDLNGGLQLTASDLSFLSVSAQSATATAATLNLLLVGAGSSTITVRDAQGAQVGIPVSSIPCGRPDIVDYAQLISPANGATGVSPATGTFFIEVGGAPGVTKPPFHPSLRAHFVIDTSSTVDPQGTLAPATPPPNAVTPVSTPPPGSSIGYESGVLPQLAAGNTYTAYVYHDTCELPWNAGTFST